MQIIRNWNKKKVGWILNSDWFLQYNTNEHLALKFFVNFYKKVLS